jgi:lambda family phage tail tape measure protein
MALNRDAAFRLKVNVDGANQISAFSRSLKGLEGTAQLSKTQLGQMNIQINRMAREAGNTTAGIRQHIAALTSLRDRVELNSKAYQRLGNDIDRLQAKLRAASDVSATGGGAGALQGLQALPGRLAAVAAATAGIVLATRSIVDTGIAAIESERRLRSLSQGFDAFTQVQYAAAQAAQRFGITQTQANQEFAQIYARLRPIGLTLDEITTVYNGFNTAAKLSGTNAQEAGAAFLQLSQGLGTGVLRGEELNSVFEQTPVVVQAIAKEMGVGVGQIRELAKEGKITSDIVINALRSIERDGASKLEEALKGPEQQFRNLSIAVEDLKLTAADFALPAIISGVQALTSAVRFLNDIVKSVDWDLIGRALAQAGPIATGGGLADMPPAGQRRMTRRSMGPALTPDIIAGVQARSAAGRRRPRAASGGGGGGGKSAKSEIREITQGELDASIKINAARLAENELLVAQAQFDLSILEIDKQKLGVRAKQKEQGEAINRLQMAEVSAAKELGSAIAQDFLERTKLQENYNRTVEDLEIKAGIITGEKLKELEIDREVKAIREQFPALTQAQIDKIRGLVVASKEVKDSFRDTFSESLKQYYEQITNLGTQVADSVKGAFQGLEDQLTSFVTTGKASFADLARSILEDIARIAIRQAIIAPLVKGVGGIFGLKFADGGVFAQNGIQKFARGGIVNGPTMFPFAKGIGLMGEAGPEAIMPLRRGADGRLGVAASGGAGVNVTVNVDAGSSQVQGDGPNANQLGRVIGAAVQAEIVKQQRPGGLLATTR